MSKYVKKLAENKTTRKLNILEIRVYQRTQGIT